MATSAGEIEVKLSLNADDFKKGLTQGKSDVNDFNDALASLGKKLLAVFSFTEIGNFFRQSLAAYAENEQSVAKLTAALNAQGIASQKTLNSLTEMSQALQDHTGISKTAITNAQALLTTFGIQGETMQKVTQASLDLSAATGVDLQRAALLMGKAFEGETGTLSRYGVIVNSHLDLNKRFAAVMDQVNDRFGGTAQAMAQTYTGKLNIMRLAFNDLQEEVGSFMAGPGGGFLDWMTATIRVESEALHNISQMASAMGGLGNVLKVAGIEILRMMVDSATQLLQILAKTIGVMPLLGNAAKNLENQIKNVNTALNKQIDTWQATTQNAIQSETKKQAAVLQTKQIVTQSVDATDKFVADKMDEDVKRHVKYYADAKKAHEDFTLGFITTDAQMWEFASSMRDTFFQGFGDSLAKTIVEGKNFGEQMQQVFQQMAEAIISYIVQMIAKLLVLLALEEATGTQGMAAAGGGGLFGGFMADGGMINEPSVITGLHSGRSIIAGEAGPEMVVPMSGGNQTADEMGGMPAMGGGSKGGNITINISGQFLEADQNTWNRLVREQIIPQIRRYSMTSPSSPFNRVRGVV